MANNIPLSGAADKRKGVDILQPTFRIDGSLILVSSLSLKIISTSAINIIYSPAAESTFSLLGLFHTETYNLVFIWIYEDDD